MWAHTSDQILFSVVQVRHSVLYLNLHLFLRALRPISLLMIHHRNHLEFPLASLPDETKRDFCRILERTTEALPTTYDSDSPFSEKSEVISAL